MDKIQKCHLAELYYHNYNRQVANGVAKNVGIKVKLKYNKNAKSGSTLEIFVCVIIIQLTHRNQTLNELQTTHPL